MVERWNIGFQKDISHFNLIVHPAGCGTINPTLHYPRTHYPTIPAFQHSNWGEAPKFGSFFVPWCLSGRMEKVLPCLRAARTGRHKKHKNHF